MTSRSLLSRYVRSVRERKGYSVEYVSSKAGVSSLEYLKFEENPSKTPLNVATVFISALSMNTVEFIYFQVVARASIFQSALRREEITKNPSECEKNLQKKSNVLSLHGAKELPKMDDLTASENEEC